MLQYMEIKDRNRNLISWPTSHNALLIKASNLMAHSALQAELLALQLAMEVANFLNMAGTVFLADNEVIATTMARRNFDQESGHWSLRPWLTPPGDLARGRDSPPSSTLRPARLLPIAVPPSTVDRHPLHRLAASTLQPTASHAGLHA
uniref:Uncharacterized protein n=1 Tax=Oryza glumipatula TaxID=40148 RepID=A0A0E0BT82_9ORYZ